MNAETTENPRLLLIGADALLAGALSGSGDPSGGANPPVFELESLGAINDAVSAARAARTTNRPFALAFVDADANSPDTCAQLFERLWQIDRSLQIVVYTQAPVRTFKAIVGRIGWCDDLLLLAKPFCDQEVFQIALVLCAKWRLSNLVERPARPAQSFEIAPTRGLRILLAEDDEINRTLAEQVLTTAGYACVAVADGKQALEISQTEKFDVILMDCQMPELDGIEATRQIRAREKASRRIPIIALTAGISDSDRQRCVAAGMDGYLTKPLQPAHLIETIETFAAGKRAGTSSILGVSKVVAGLLNSNPDNPAAAPAAADNDNPLDVDDLLDRCMGNVDFLKNLLEKFKHRLGEDIGQLQQAVAGHNTEATARLAHSLRGSAANVSAGSLTRLATELEKLGASGDFDLAEACLARIREEADRCVHYAPDVPETCNFVDRPKN